MKVTCFCRFPITVTLYVVVDGETGFRQHELNNNFRFCHHNDLNRLFNGFQFGVDFRTKARHVYDGEEVFVLGLYRMTTCNSSTDVCYPEIFGRAHDDVSRMFALFIQHLVHNFCHLVQNNMAYWTPSFPKFTDAIKSKCGNLGCPFPADHFFSVFGFIDCTTIETCSVGTGPLPDGARPDTLIQQAYYNGWKRKHGLKFQACVLPNGMIFNMGSVISMRHNDNYNLRESRILERIAASHPVDSPTRYCLYGDAAYICQPYLKGRHDGNLSERQTLENAVMSACRESVEWYFNKVKALWKRVCTRHCLKVRRSPCDAIVIAAVILTDAHTCMYQHTTGIFFDLFAPKFEQWVEGIP